MVVAKNKDWKSSFFKCYDQDLFNRYGIPLSEITTDMFRLSKSHSGPRQEAGNYSSMIIVQKVIRIVVTILNISTTQHMFPTTNYPTRQ